MKKILFLLGLILVPIFFYYCISNHRFGIESDVSSRVNAEFSSNDGLVIDVDGRDVVLAGLVDSEEQKVALGAKARGVYGVRVVDNQLNVVAPTPVVPEANVADVADITFEDAVVFEAEPEDESDMQIAPIPEAEPEQEAEAEVEPIADIIVEEAEDVSDVEEVVEPVKVDPCDKEFARLLEAENINFASSKAVIRQASYPLLDKIVQAAKNCDAPTININGHTDNTGSRAFNVQLSMDRANAVAIYLRDKGVTQVINTFGYGPDKPVTDNATSKGRALNRRIEFTVDVD